MSRAWLPWNGPQDAVGTPTARADWLLAWRDQAACNGAPSAMFDPEAGSRRTPGSTIIAGIVFRDLTATERYVKAQFCFRCPVRGDCLLDAFTERTITLAADPWAEALDIGLSITARGIWGGTTEDERYRTRALPTPQRVAVLGSLMHHQARTDGLAEEGAA